MSEGGIAGRIKDSGPLGWVLLAVALTGAVVLVVAEFSTISYRTIGNGACPDRAGNPALCKTVGHESHAYALLILLPLALAMAWGAVVGRSRAAATALLGIGVAVLVIALAIDLPKLDDRRGLEVRYNEVKAHTGAGFKLELLGGVLLILAGGLALGRPEPQPKEPRRRPREGAAAGAP